MCRVRIPPNSVHATWVLQEPMRATSEIPANPEGTEKDAEWCDNMVEKIDVCRVEEGIPKAIGRVSPPVLLFRSCSLMSSRGFLQQLC
mmetsp:Transcript_67133/g.123646  ORF Transcript_67133/g.123646 Transcript_67133/m.123646 type:complete len:88 (+) Transcript_67133:283-546(+)